MKLMAFFPVDRERLGRLIRARRKERALRLKDLQDVNISSATISSIERGMKNISLEKITYLCEKLDLDINQFSSFVEIEEQKELKIREQLLLIEHSIELFGPEHGLEQLRAFNLDRKSKWMSQYTYLKGKCYFFKENWDKARRQVQYSLDVLDTEPDLEISNLKAACCCLLAQISDQERNDFEQTIYWIDLGIQSFHIDGERKQIQYELMILKARIFAKQDNWEKAVGISEELWEQRELIQDTRLTIELYKLRALHRFKQGNQTEAKELVFHGLSLAKMCIWREGAIDLLHVLAKIYMEENELNTAEQVLKQASHYKEKVSQDERTILTLTQLGELYNIKNNWQEAEVSLKEAVKRAKHHSNKELYTKALEILGDCYKGQAQYLEATKVYQIAIEQAEKYHYLNIARNALIKFIQCQEVLETQPSMTDLERLYRLLLKK